MEPWELWKNKIGRCVRSGCGCSERLTKREGVRGRIGEGWSRRSDIDPINGAKEPQCCSIKNIYCQIENSFDFFLRYILLDLEKMVQMTSVLILVCVRTFNRTFKEWTIARPNRLHKASVPSTHQQYIIKNCSCNAWSNGWECITPEDDSANVRTKNSRSFQYRMCNFATYFLSVVCYLTPWLFF